MKQIKKEIEFLEYAYNQILIEKDTYSFILKKNKALEGSKILSENTENLLKKSILEFNKFLISIKVMLKNRKYEKKQDDLLFRVATYITIDLKDSKEEEIKKVLSHGSEVVLNELKKHFDKQEKMSKTIENLIMRFIDFENNLIKSLI